MANDEKQRPGESYHYSVTDTRDGCAYDFDAKLLGQATNRRPRHSHGTGSPCRACRWVEVTILRQLDTPTSARDRYVVVHVGRSTLDGEVDRVTVTETSSPYVVMETLAVSRDGESTLPRVARFALAEAAAHDLGIESVWIERPS